MLVRHKFHFVGNMVSTKGIEGHVYQCKFCSKALRTKDLLPLDEASRTYKFPGCKPRRMY